MYVQIGEPAVAWDRGRPYGERSNTFGLPLASGEVARAGVRLVVVRHRDSPTGAPAGTTAGYGAGRGGGVKVLAVGSQKGGVSKSTSSLYLATRAVAYLGGSMERPAVGLLDRDESKNLTELVQLRPELLRPGVVLLGGDGLPPAADGLQLVVIDTPPGLSAIQSLKEAHLVLVPVLPEDQGVANLVKYLRNIEAQRITVSPNMRLVALLPAMVDRTILHRQRLEDIERIAAHHRPPLLILPPVHRRARIAAYDLDAPDYDAPAKELFAHALSKQTAPALPG